jgi:hypothetical protein
VTTGIAGEAITAGQLVYLKAADTKYYKAQCDGTAEESTVAGVALNGSATGQYVTVQTEGQYTSGATVTKGVTYCVGANTGAIVPQADVAANSRLVYFGYAVDTSVIAIMRKVTGVTL